MAKGMLKDRQNGTNEAAETMAEALGGRKTKALSSAFPAVWVPQAAGEFILAQLTAVEKIQPKGSDKPFESYNLGLDQWKASFEQSGNPYTPIRGEVIAVSGDILNRALKDVKVGSVVAIEYKGLGKKTGKRSPCKIFNVQEVLGD